MGERAEVIAPNIRRLRQRSGKSQAEIASRCGMSLSAFRRIEAGEVVPRVDTLQALAEGFEVQLQDLLAPAFQLERVRFRAKKQLKCREQVLTDMSRWLQDYCGLEDLLDETQERDSLKKIPVPERPDLLKRAEDAAEHARKAFGLREGDPIRDICGLLEDKGVKVYSMQVHSDDFFGLSVAEKDTGPAIAVNTWDRISVERWIFSAAHELGHLILHLSAFKSEETEENENEELQANHFASCFLMPRRAFEKEWSETYGLPFIERVYKVKHIFRVSYKTVLYRLDQMDSRGTNYWPKFYAAYQRMNGTKLAKHAEPASVPESAYMKSMPASRRPEEPENIQHGFVQDRLYRLVRKAIEDGKITRSRAAEILRKTLDEFHDLQAAWVE
ncbi:MAG: hypothetical protein AMXMBFR7_45680 [Planctomycetota bacterium]